ncbi:MAG: hypothetical protein IPO65_13900 [Saprospiraceae bacterium]|nr:hypothetical protein [Saprospiraceae bacterium]
MAQDNYYIENNQNKNDRIHKTNNEFKFFNIWRQYKDEISKYYCFDTIPDLKSDIDSIYFLLIYSDCVSKSKNDHETGYENMLKALNLALSVGNDTITSEVIKKITNYHLFNYKDTVSQIYYIHLHKEYCYNLFENTTNELFLLRYELNKAYINNKQSSFDKSPWYKLASRCETYGYHKLLIDIYLSFGTYLSYNPKNYKETIYIFNKTIDISKKIGGTYFNDIWFICRSNIGREYLEQEKYKSAIETFKEIISSNFSFQKPENKHYIYSWLSDAYLGANKIDSAYQFLLLANKEKEIAKSTDFTLKINNIENKYRNKDLKYKLTESELKRRNSIYLIAFISLIGLFFFILYVFSRINSKQKQKLLKQEIENKTQMAEISKLHALENERNRISSEMHDDLGSGLTRIRYLSDKALVHASETEKEEITKISAYANDLVRNMGEIIWAMNSRFDNAESLAAYIRRYASEYLEEHHIDLSFSVDAGQDATTLSGEKGGPCFGDQRNFAQYRKICWMPFGIYPDSNHTLSTNYHFRKWR